MIFSNPLTTYFTLLLPLAWLCNENPLIFAFPFIYVLGRLATLLSEVQEKSKAEDKRLEEAKIAKEKALINSIVPKVNHLEYMIMRIADRLDHGVKREEKREDIWKETGKKRGRDAQGRAADATPIPPIQLPRMNTTPLPSPCGPRTPLILSTAPSPIGATVSLHSRKLSKVTSPRGFDIEHSSASLFGEIAQKEESHYVQSEPEDFLPKRAHSRPVLRVMKPNTQHELSLPGTPRSPVMGGGMPTDALSATPVQRKSNNEILQVLLGITNLTQTVAQLQESVSRLENQLAPFLGNDTGEHQDLSRKEGTLDTDIFFSNINAALQSVHDECSLNNRILKNVEDNSYTTINLMERVYEDIEGFGRAVCVRMSNTFQTQLDRALDLIVGPEHTEDANRLRRIEFEIQSLRREIAAERSGKFGNSLVGEESSILLTPEISDISGRVRFDNRRKELSVTPEIAIQPPTPPSASSASDPGDGSQMSGNDSYACSNRSLLSVPEPTYEEEEEEPTDPLRQEADIENDSPRPNRAHRRLTLNLYKPSHEASDETLAEDVEEEPNPDFDSASESSSPTFNHLMAEELRRSSSTPLFGRSTSTQDSDSDSENYYSSPSNFNCGQPGAEGFESGEAVMVALEDSFEDSEDSRSVEEVDIRAVGSESGSSEDIDSLLYSSAGNSPPSASPIEGAGEMTGTGDTDEESGEYSH